MYNLLFSVVFVLSPGTNPPKIQDTIIIQQIQEPNQTCVGSNCNIRYRFFQPFRKTR